MLNPSLCVLQFGVLVKARVSAHHRHLRRGTTCTPAPPSWLFMHRLRPKKCNPYLDVNQFQDISIERIADFEEVNISMKIYTHTHCRLNDLEEEKDDFDVALQIPEIERPEKQFDNQLTLFDLKQPRGKTGDHIESSRYVKTASSRPTGPNDKRVSERGNDSGRCAARNLSTVRASNVDEFV